MTAKSKFARDILKAQVDRPEDGLLVPATMEWFMQAGKNMQFVDEEGIGIVVDLIQEQNKRITERKSRTSFGSSTSSNCMREQVLNIRLGDKNVPEIDYKLANIFDDGVWRNLRWILVFHRMGVLNEFEETTYSDKYNISWTPDCRVDLSRYYGKKYKDVPVEIKGMNDYEFKQFQGRTGNGRFAYSRTMQVHTYMLAAGLSNWLIFAENKNNQDFEEHFVPRDENIIKMLKRRYGYMQESLDTDKLPAIECEMHESDTKYIRCSRMKDCTKLAKLKYKSLKPMKGKASLERKAQRVSV